MSASSMSSESSVEIQKLYEFSEKLDGAGEDAGKHQEWYQGIIDGTSGSAKAKSLAAQLLPRYFKHFPALLDTGINALTDLCEEEDLQIRILAVRAFPLICKDTPAAVDRAADVLGQLLQTEAQVELDNVKHSLVSLLRIDFKKVIDVLFVQITERDEMQRERAIHFLREKVSAMKEELLSDKHEDNQKHLAENVKKALRDVTGEEFKVFMDLLKDASIFKGPGAQELVEIIAQQADLQSDFKPTDEDQFYRLISCIEAAFPYFEKNPSSAHAFVSYIGTKVLPFLDQMTTDNQTRIFQKLSEMVPYTIADDARQMLPLIYTSFKKNVPDDAEDDANLQLTQIECILYLLHYLGTKAPAVLHSQCGVAPVYTGQPSDMVTETEQSKQNLADFQKRIKYLEKRNAQAQKEATNALKALQGAGNGAKKETSSLIVRATSNITRLLQPLLKAKPAFLGTKAKDTFQYYWNANPKKRKDAEQGVASAAGDKKRVRGIYQTPGRRGVVAPRGTASAPRGLETSAPKTRGRGRGGRSGRGGRGRGGL